MTDASRAERFEAVIGLEVHVQLRTASKIFCGCSAGYGAAPNTQVCPVCLGHPGVLPVLNREAVTFALRFGLAVGAAVRSPNVFARKNYFYPDLPKGYQISQYTRPVLTGGEVVFTLRGAGRRVRLTRAHLEEDAGKSFHPESGREAATWVDLNRSGVPLLEVVSEPDIRGPDEAHAYLERIRQLVVYLEICDGNMEEGSLRCDANISVRERGETGLNPKTEIKNLNSFRNVSRALAWEFGRQAGILEEGGIPEQATRLWDDGQGRTRVMRSKEEAHDYRYFPEPDLPPLTIEPEWIDAVRASLPELPWDTETRFVDAYGLSGEDAVFLSGTRELAAYYERVARTAGDGKTAANWVMTEVMRWVKEEPQGFGKLKVTPENLGTMIRMIADGTISGTIAKQVFQEMVANGGEPRAIVLAKGLRPIGDAKAVAAVVAAVLAAHPGPADDYLNGKEAAFQFLVGQIMRATGGRADPGAARGALTEALDRIRRERSEEAAE
jgi:aspartyl-tRNA(Asn)/glutamyl-tRNA(Gln) amidotransferase subunit B